MDHHEQHHQHHVHEREQEKKREKEREKERERAEEKRLLPVHPAWLLVVGVVLVLLALVVWTFLLR
jgi:hypothetical protein